MNGSSGKRTKHASNSQSIKPNGAATLTEAMSDEIKIGTPSNSSKRASGTHHQVQRISLDDIGGDNNGAAPMDSAATAAPASTGDADSTRKRKRAASKGLGARISKYSRGAATVDLKSVTDKKMKRKLRGEEKTFRQAAEKAARAEVLLPSEQGYVQAEGMEETWRFSQEVLREHVDTRTSGKMFNLDLPTFGPYNIDFTRNGRALLLGGRKGHIALMDWSSYKLMSEFHVNETIRDVKFLHNESMFAVAQRKYVYLYDNNGIELHCLRHHLDVNRMEFLPYHFLLATVGKTGYLKYQDTSTGAKVAELRTKLGECDTMCQNPRNAILHLGHKNGQVSLWSPNMSQPLVKIFTHPSPVLAVAVDPMGLQMVTAGLEGQVRVWDLRTYKQLHSYYSVRPATSLAISQTGLLAVGCGPHVQVWKDALSTKAKYPYLVQQYPGLAVRDVQYCPFEDILGVSHSKGFTSMVVPGAGEANFDSFEANPYESRRQKREHTVVALLEKLQPDMITIDNNLIGTIDRAAPEVLKAEQKEQQAERKAAEGPAEDKHKMRGRNTAKKRWKRKQTNVMDQKKQDLQEEMQKDKKHREKAQREAERQAAGLPKSALDRFRKT